MSSTLAPGAVVRLRGGSLKKTDVVDATGSLRGTKCVVVKAPRQAPNPNGRIEERVVVKPILEGGTTGIPIELSTSMVEEKDRSLVTSVAAAAGRVKRFFGGAGPGRARQPGESHRQELKYDPVTKESRWVNVED